MDTTLQFAAEGCRPDSAWPLKAPARAVTFFLAALIVVVMHAAGVGNLQAKDSFDRAVRLYSEKNYAPAAVLFDRVARCDNKKAAMARYMLANCYSHLNRLQDAAREYQLSYQLAPKGQQSLYCLSALKTLSNQANQSSPASFSSHQSTIDVHPVLAQVSETQQNNVDLLLQKAYQLEQNKRFAEAEKFYIDGLHAAEKLGATSQYLINALDALAGFCVQRKQLTRAEQLYERELSAVIALRGRTASDVWRLKRQIAQVYQAQGNYPAAQHLYEECLNTREDMLARAQSARAANVIVLKNELAIAHDDMAGIFFSQSKNKEGFAHSQAAQELRQSIDEEYQK